MSKSDSPRLGVTDLHIRKFRGVAGQISYRATYVFNGQDPDGETWTNTGDVEFVGTSYGSPGVVVMIHRPSTSRQVSQVFVTEPERFGQVFNQKWVENFVNGVQS